MNILWNGKKVHEIVSVNNFMKEEEIRIYGSVGLSTVCFVGSDYNLKHNVPPTTLGVLITRI